MAQLLIPVVVVAYVTGIVLAVVGTLKRSGAARGASAVALGIACSGQLALLVGLGIRSGRLPFSYSFELFATLGWAVLLAYLVVLARFRVHAAGVVLPPIAFALSVIGFWNLPEARLDSTWVRPVDVLHVHIGLATLGMAAFFVAAAMSFIYVLQDRALKTKRGWAWVERLPPLDRADRAGLEAMLWGFPLFTVAIVLGLALNASARGAWLSAEAKQLFPLLAWAVFAGVLAARLLRGFRGRRAAYLTIAGFLLGLLTLIGVRA